MAKTSGNFRFQIQKKWKRRNDSKERVIGKADTRRLRLLDIASRPKCPMSQQKSPKNWLDPEKTKARKEKRPKKAKVQRAKSNWHSDEASEGEEVHRSGVAQGEDCAEE